MKQVFEVKVSSLRNIQELKELQHSLGLVSCRDVCQLDNLIYCQSD